MSMKNSFSQLANNKFSRNFGGTSVGTADPYLTGYHFIYFAQLPAKLQDYTGALATDDIRNILSATCMSVTPPGGTLNKVEFTGLGGIKWAVPGNIDYGNTVSVKFTEMNGTPILNIFHNWVKMIRDYRTGATDLEDGAEGAGYTKKTYSGLLFYWTTAPDGKTVEYSACYDGVFPTKDPQDLFSSDIENVGKLEPEIEFHVDYVWHEDWVKDKCQTYANNFAGIKNSIINTSKTIGG